MERKHERPKRIRDLLQVSQAWLQERGVESARLDAELLIAAALGESRLRLYLDLDRPLTEEELVAVRPLLARRGRREPVAYIVGEKEFYGHAFEVTSDVLVPRPDTESVVERALRFLPKDAQGTVADVCTGSGCIALAIALERPGLRVIATDVSADALGVAKRNIARHKLDDRVELRQGDLIAPLQGERDLLGLIANPPYIERREEPMLAPEIRLHEPALALYGEGPGGVGHHARILAAAAPMLCLGGFVVLESGHDQGPALQALAHPGFGPATLFEDLAGSVRGWRPA